jgi:surface protein
MNKIYLSGNYVIVEKDGNVYEYPRTLSVYTIQGSNYVIKERIDDGQFVLPIADIGTYFDEAGAVAYTEATLVTFLRENTGFKTAGGGSPAEFIMLVKTDNAGISASNQFIIPTGPFVGSYNYDVDWGDGNFSSGVTGSVQHTYASAGIYTIKISGTFPKIYFNNGGDKLKLLEVQNWGAILWQRMDRSFSGCQNMTITATDAPDFSALINGTFDVMFSNCDALIGGNLSNWDTSGFTTLVSAFDNTSLFNGDLSSWDVSNVTSFASMFILSDSFNNGGASGIGNWNVSNATTFSRMFQQTPFNQDISSWNTTNCTIMEYMFFGNTAFNQDISSWDVSNVITFNNMFSGASSFNQNLGAWDISSLINAQQVFRNSAMSIANYTDTIVGWANYVKTNGFPLNVNMTTQTGRTFDTSRSGGFNFATAGDARTYLTSATPTGAGWTISGDTVI